MHNLETQKLLFKAYRKGKSAKVPLNNASYTFDEVKNCENYGATCKDDIVDISIDDIEMFDALLDLLDARNIMTYALYSPHGGHTYWRYPENSEKFADGKDKLTACGFTVDIHSKGTYIPLKCDGKLRSEVYDDELSVIPQVPDFLLPIGDVKDKNILWKMTEGNGRNDVLSKHVFILNNRLRMSREQITDAINIINDFIFDEPVSQDELSTILRDETFEKMSTETFFERGKFLHNIFGDYLISKYHVVIIDKQLYAFNGEIYEHTDENDNIANIMIDEIAFLKDSMRTEVIKYLRVRAKKCQMADERYIAFKNGVYDILTEELLPFSPDVYVTVQIPWNYNPSAYSKIADKVLNDFSVRDESVRQLLEECIGYCFYRRNELGSSFFLVGDKSNGKSTFLKMIKNMLGKKNYSPLDFSELADRFNTAMMYGKLANIGDDIDDEYMSGSKVAIFKKLVTGDTIKAEEKNQPVFMFEPFCKLFFAANEMPRIKDKTGAVLRRIVIVPFNASFDKNDPSFKHNIIKDLITPEATEYIIRLGIEGLHRILDNQNFTQPESVKQKLREYERDNDVILQFIDDLPDGENSLLNQACDDVYAKYLTYCARNGYHYTGTQRTLTMTLKKRFGIVTTQTQINGKRFRSYTR